METNTFKPIELTSSSCAPIMNWWERIDPVNEMNWSDTISSKWIDVHNTEYGYEISSMGYLQQVSRQVYSPIQVSDKRLYSPRAMMSMALLHEWNQLTTFQLATFLGVNRHAVWDTMMDLFNAGVVRRMIPNWWGDDDTPEDTGSGSIWRINRKSWMTSRWFENLDPLNWILVTNNLDPQGTSIGSNAPAAMRHNLGTVEIALKAMENIPEVVGAWGEGHCLPNMLYDPAMYETDKVRNNVGDGMLVLENGRIIIFEVSGSSSINQGSSTGNRLVEKAAAWTSVCGKSELDVTVVFVEMSMKPRVDHMMLNTRYGAMEQSQRYVARNSVRERGQERIYVVSAWDWFPFARGVSRDFASLNVNRVVTGERVSLLEGCDGIDVTNDLVVNTLGALHTPWWIHRTSEQRAQERAS